ncbi:PHA/PHB synthase family protein [Granulicoccus phenolivorans]|uniref:PHA/PHB synthase family protein n=1 Tax=Granulicoccus phenolivorans TaxID=266854 RepID=UPI000416F050|nr:alpha/beta fold hydrolase [Granulicoccus phenolivorans]
MDMFEALRQQLAQPLKPLQGVRRKVKAKVDPVGWFESAGNVAWHATMNPLAVTSATMKYLTQLASVPLSSASVATGAKTSGALPIPEKDRRWHNTAWTKNAFYYTLLQNWLATDEYLENLIDAGAADDFKARKTRQFARVMMDMLSPSNSALTNPDVAVKTFETGGKSLAQGAKYFFEDMTTRQGRPQRVDEDAFTVGENMASSKGKVVFKNDLIEVLQYTPLTEQVHEVPLLMTPPWINKYYIMDLNPGRSLAEWANKHNRTVFMISYRNPDSSMRDTSFEDYMNKGVLTALDVVEDITGAKKIDLLGVCLGGAMSMIALSYLRAKGDDRVGNITLVNTLLDYTNTGDLGLMSDPETVYKLDTLMDTQGYLDGTDMAGTFDLLRAQDLIFSYWVSRWMLGEEPPAFDLLVWNEDATRMPARMHSEYLTLLYGQNALANGELVMNGQKLSLGKVTNDVYIIGAIKDHIVPWTGSFDGVKHLGGQTRYVLASGGHIAGIVNPPSKKAWIEVVGDPAGQQPKLPTDAEQWRSSAEHQAKSWWEDWAVWSAKRAGALQAPPPMGSEKYPATGDAPGEYVFS